jgi:hypothetical protein
VCREIYPERSIGIAAVRFEGEERVFHTYATWSGWALDHAGWNREADLLSANAEFEGCPLERVEITLDLAEFCPRHCCRMPHQYWDDPGLRAREYVARHEPPWA